MTASESLDLTFAALSHPARRAILARLAQGEATVNELAQPFEMSLPAISKHIRVLEDAGLIERGRKAQWLCIGRLGCALLGRNHAPCHAHSDVRHLRHTVWPKDLRYLCRTLAQRAEIGRRRPA